MGTTPNILSSPTSTASYDIVSSVSGPLSDRADVTSDDEVVWLPRASGSSQSYESSMSDTDDDDCVVLSRPRSPLRSIIRTSSEESSDVQLSSAISGLSLGQTSASYRPAPRGIGIKRPSSAATVKKTSVPKTLQPSRLGEGLSESQKKARKKVARKARKTARAGSAPTFPIVDDASSDVGSASSTSTVSGYEDAASYITSYVLPSFVHMTK
jgi:hypothetical protein